jgi:hypothetical protein
MTLNRFHPEGGGAQASAAGHRPEPAPGHKARSRAPFTDKKPVWRRARSARPRHRRMSFSQRLRRQLHRRGGRCRRPSLAAPDGSPRVAPCDFGRRSKPPHRWSSSPTRPMHAEGRSYEEIADRMAVSVGAVRQLLSPRAARRPCGIRLRETATTVRRVHVLDGLDLLAVDSTGDRAVACPSCQSDPLTLRFGPAL